MFMFTFSVIAISIIGLFFQVTSALALFFSFQQTGLGQQIISWHTMAYEYACSSPAVIATPVGGAVVTPSAATIKNMRPTSPTNTNPVYSGINWNTVIFNGNFIDPDTGAASATTTRFVMTYTDPSQKYGGTPAGEVGRQMKAIALKSSMLPGVITSVAGVKRASISVYTNAGDQLTANVVNIPNTIPTGGNALVTIANCP